MASAPPPGYDWVDEPQAPRIVVPRQPAPQTAPQIQGDINSAANSGANAARTTALTPHDVDRASAEAVRAAVEAQAAVDNARRAEQLRTTLPEVRRDLLNVVRNAREAQRLSREGWFATGFGSGWGRPSGSSGADLDALLEQISSNTAFDRLSRMRMDSPTGGALGNVTERELSLLQATIASPKVSQSDAQFQRSMDAIINAYADTYQRLGGEARDLGDDPANAGGELLDDALTAVRQGTPIPGAAPAAVPMSGTGPPSGPLSGGGAASTALTLAGIGLDTTGGELGGSPLPQTNRPGEMTTTDSRLSGLASGVSQQANDELGTDVQAGVGFAGPLTNQFTAEVQAAANDPRVTREQLNAILARQKQTVDQAYGALRNMYPGIIPDFGASTVSDEMWRAIEQGRAAGRVPNFRPSHGVDYQGGSNMFSGAANTGAGSFVMGVGEALTGGWLDEISAHPEVARRGMTQVAADHPGANLAGHVVGSIVPGALAERVAGVGLRTINQLRGVGAGATSMRAAARGGDALYGSIYGAGSDHENRLRGLAIGAPLSLAGGEGGRRVIAGFGRAATGARDATTAYLANRGVPMSLGQIAEGGGGLSRAYGRFENTMEAFPGLGRLIRARRGEAEGGALNAFNRDVFDESLESIGRTTPNTGRAGVGEARTAVRDAYNNATRGVEVDAATDPIFARQMGLALRQGQKLPPDMQARFDWIVNNRIAPALDSGRLTGRQFQSVRQRIRSDIAETAKGPGRGDLTHALRNAEGALERLVRRQSPETVSAIKAADAANRQVRTVQRAVAAARDANGRFTPRQLGTAAEATARKFGGREGTEGVDFVETIATARAAADRLRGEPNTRRWVAAVFPAAVGTGAATGYIPPEVAALFAAVGLPYTRGGQKAFQAMLTSRPEVVRRAGERILARENIGNAIGRAPGAAQIDGVLGEER